MIWSIMTSKQLKKYLAIFYVDENDDIQKLLDDFASNICTWFTLSNVHLNKPTAT